MSIDNALSPIQTITIAGVGLLGGSLGLALKQAGFKGRIAGFGRRSESLEAARARGCIDEMSTDIQTLIPQTDLLVLATPLSQFPALLTAAARGKPKLIVTDVGSTKSDVLEEARRQLPAALLRRFIGAHPMAGGEQRGPECARADLFTGKPCVLVHDAQFDADALAVVTGMWATLRMRLVYMSATQHDRMVACISHLPHVVASALVDLAARDGGLDIASTGFADTTRIASGDPKVWTDIFMSNGDAVCESIDQFVAELQHFKEMVQHRNETGITGWLSDSKAARDRWNQERRKGVEDHVV